MYKVIKNAIMHQILYYRNKIYSDILQEEWFTLSDNPTVIIVLMKFFSIKTTDINAFKFKTKLRGRERKPSVIFF